MLGNAMSGLAGENARKCNANIKGFFAGNPAPANLGPLSRRLIN
jgi:hypothetical protein